MANNNAVNGADNITQTSGTDTLTFTNTNQVDAQDFFDGGGNTDAIVISSATGLSFNFTTYGTDATHGFHNYEALTFNNTSGTSSGTFNAAQFGAGLISTSLAVTGAGGTQSIVINNVSNFSAAAWTFATWTNGTDTITLNGTGGTDTITGSSQNDTIVGGVGADMMTGGAGSDVFSFVAGDGVLSVGGSGTSGTISGYDTIVDFTPGATAAASEQLAFAIASVAANTAGTNGSDSTLQLNTASTVKSHSITNGIITFDDNNTFGGAVSLTSLGDVAAVVQYLQANNPGVVGTEVAFVATISGVSHTYVFRWSNGTLSNDLLIDLANVSATSISASSNRISVVDATAPAVASVVIPSGGADNSYIAGDQVNVTINFSEAVTVNTGGGTPTLTLNIGGVNHAASYVSGSGTSALTFRYTIAGGDNDANGISIASNQLVLNGGTIKDAAGNNATLTHGTITDQATALVDTVAPTAPGAPSVAENSSGGINATEASNGTPVVVSLTGTGAVAGDTLTVNWGGQTVNYTLAAGDISGNSATVTVPSGTITTQGNGTFNVSAKITDIAGNVGATSSNTSVTVDTVAPSFSSGTTATAIDENSGAGQVVYDTNATDAASVTYSLGGADAALFSINPSTGEVTLTGNPDYETQSSYSFDVTATDSAGNDTTQTVTLAINNLDEVAPTITSGELATAIAENSGAGQVVYDANATDTADISAGVTFSLKPIDDFAAFSINPSTGEVTLTGNPDYETQSSYSFTVLADDGINPPTEKAVSLQVGDVDGVSIKGTSKNNVISDTKSPKGQPHATGEEDTIKGRAGNDKISGVGGNDTLNGGAGNDKLIGGLGVDTLLGKAGADKFVFNSVLDSTTANSDTIVDFKHSQRDKIDLHGIDADSLTTGDQAFHFLGNNNAFTKHAGELRFDAVNHVVEGDVDADGQADFAIHVNVSHLMKGDFVL